MVTKQEKIGKVSNVEIITASNGNELYRISVNTSISEKLDGIANLDNITSFMLDANERTEFSVLMPVIDNISAEKMLEILRGKDVNIIVFKSTIRDLSDNICERVRYKTNDGHIRTASTMSRTYLKGSQNATDEIAYKAMKDELQERLLNGDFKIVDDSQTLRNILTPSKYMQIAIDEAREGIRNGHGGPFGTAIVKDGFLIASGHNRVLINKDPTCHGEVDAIRKACQKLNTHDLSGCELYTTGEPCHMCLCACMWANISKIYYGCTIEDNGLIGFRDDKFDKIFGGRDILEGFMTELDRESCLELFEEYKNLYHTIY